MKHCSICNLDLSDENRFCTNCGGGLAEVTVEMKRAYNGYDEQTLVSGSPPPVRNVPPQPTIAAPLYRDERFAAPAAELPKPKRLGLILAAVFAVLVLGGLGSVAGYYFWFSDAAIERKLDDAIKRGNLVKPEGASAYDYYHELKQRGASPTMLARYEDQLVSGLTTGPKKMLDDFVVPANKEPEPSEWQEAAKPMSWASEMKPTDNALAARAKYIEGRVAFLSGQKDQAVDAWKRASELDRSWAVAPNSLGIIFIERKDYQTARAYLLDAIHRDDKWAVPYNNVGTTYFFEKNDDKAESYYRKAVERAPNWPRPHAWLGDIAMHRKHYDQAAEEYQKVLDLAPPGTTTINLTDIKKRLESAKKKSQEVGDETEVPD
jgi:tetratricopeptide (TPR) repeat protein